MVIIYTNGFMFPEIEKNFSLFRNSLLDAIDERTTHPIGTYTMMPVMRINGSQVIKRDPVEKDIDYNLYTTTSSSTYKLPALYTGENMWKKWARLNLITYEGTDNEKNYWHVWKVTIPTPEGTESIKIELSIEPSIHNHPADLIYQQNAVMSDGNDHQAFVMYNNRYVKCIYTDDYGTDAYADRHSCLVNIVTTSSDTVYKFPWYPLGYMEANEQQMLHYDKYLLGDPELGKLTFDCNYSDNTTHGAKITLHKRNSEDDSTLADELYFGYRKSYKGTCPWKWRVSEMQARGVFVQSVSITEDDDEPHTVTAQQQRIVFVGTYTPNKNLIPIDPDIDSEVIIQGKKIVEMCDTAATFNGLTEFIAEDGSSLYFPFLSSPKVEELINMNQLKVCTHNGSVSDTFICWENTATDPIVMYVKCAIHTDRTCITERVKELCDATIKSQKKHRMDSVDKFYELFRDVEHYSMQVNYSPAVRGYLSDEAEPDTTPGTFTCYIQSFNNVVERWVFNDETGISLIFSTRGNKYEYLRELDDDCDFYMFSVYYKGTDRVLVTFTKNKDQK